jgi:hypothetical protein
MKHNALRSSNFYVFSTFVAFTLPAFLAFAVLHATIVTARNEIVDRMAVLLIVVTDQPRERLSGKHLSDHRE